MPRPPFDPKRARGDQFAGGLFDPTPVRRDASAGDAAPPPARPEQAPPKPAANELTVSQFSQMIQRTLEDGLRGQFRIKGEIANLSVRNHIYFTMKDTEAVLSCVMWASDAARLGFRPKEGDAVVATGKIGHYPQQGKTQLYVTRLEPQGVGDLQARFDALVKELRGLGYFEESRKKRMPPMPRRVAVVTSAGGAALQDVLQTARTRCPAVEFLVVDVRVQGEGAAGEVARALAALDRRRDELAIDAVIVTRGGGSREDLWAFNERIVADAAFNMHLPLVAAIGHEVDTSIIELVADKRASTPTQAAMLLLPDLSELRTRHERLGRDLRNNLLWLIQRRRDALAKLAAQPGLASPALRISRERSLLLSRAGRLREGLRGEVSAARTALATMAERLQRISPALRVVAAQRGLQSQSARLRDAMRSSLGSARLGLDGLGERLRRNSPHARASAARATLGALGPRLSRAMRQRLRMDSAMVDGFGARLLTAGPEQTIRRGYAVVTDADGRLVRSVGTVVEGQEIGIRIADGSIRARVDGARPRVED